MIVDVHYHFIPEVTQQRVAWISKAIVSLARRMGQSLDMEVVGKSVEKTVTDPTGERLIAWMEDSGVDFTCICTIDNASIESWTKEMAQQANRIMGEIAQKNSKKVMALAGVDPRRPDALDMLRQCFEEFGMRGLKYHPDYGFNPSGTESYKLLHLVQDHDGILLTHTGPLPPPARPKFADPMLLADLATDFPDLKVIAAHMGMSDWRSWAGLAGFQPNLYGDLAMWDVLAFGKYELFCRELRNILDYTGASKVLFGTDSPIFNILFPTKKWIQLIKDLPDNSRQGIHFSEEEVNAILGGNAASLLGLE
jgi:predicted TIM-barrel fold metal-dependent hydrolase